MASNVLQFVLEAQDKISGVLGTVGAKIGALETQLSPAARASQSLAGAFGNMAITAAEAAVQAGLLAAAGGAVAGAFRGFQVAAQLETATAGFVSLLGSADAAAKTVARIKEEAKKTPFELTGLIQATQQLSLVTKDGDKSIDTLLNVGKALAAAGKGQAELDRIVANLQQISLTGAVTEMDVRQFGYAGVNIMEMLAEYYTKAGMSADGLAISAAEAGEMVKASKTPYEDLTAAFALAAGEGGKFADAYENQATSFQTLWSNAKDSLDQFLAKLVEGTGAFSGLKDVLAQVPAFLDQVLIKIGEAGEAFKTANQWVNDHQWAIYAVAGAITGALVPAFIAALPAIGTAIGLFVAGAVALAPWIIGGALIGGLVAGIIWLTQNWDTAKAKISAVVKGIADYLTLTWEGIKIMAGEKTTEIVDKMTQAWTGFKTFMDGLWDGIVSLIKTGVNNVIAPINGLIEGLNNIKIEVPKIDLGEFGSWGGFSVGFPKIPTIPMLAEGGIVTRPTLAMIGEAGPEAVVPLSKGGAGGTINVYLSNNQFIGTDDLAETIGNDIAAQIFQRLKYT